MQSNHNTMQDQAAPVVQFWCDPRMPYVETRVACHSRACYQSHSHPTFSIGAVDAGQSLFQSQLSPVQHDLSAGSLVVIPAHVEHRCNPMPNQAWSYQMMHLDQAWLMALFEEHLNVQATITTLASLDQQTLAQRLPQFLPHVLNQASLYTAFSRLNQALFDSSITIFEKEQLLIVHLSQILIPAFQWQMPDQQIKQQHLLSRLLEFIDAADQFVSLQMMADQIGSSRFAIIRMFKQDLGLTPHAYQLNTRIHQARERLKQGQAISHVAYELGFCDQSHFHRVFKKHCAVTPQQYQQKLRSAI